MEDIEQPDKDVLFLTETIKSPPFSVTARGEVGFLLRKLQQREMLSMPHSRPMPSVGAGCHELRINDAENHIQWRIMYFMDDEAIVVLHVFQKRTQTTPQSVLDTSRQRLARYLRDERDSQ